MSRERAFWINWGACVVLGTVWAINGHPAPAMSFAAAAFVIGFVRKWVP